jgi:hypothetical protein
MSIGAIGYVSGGYAYNSTQKGLKGRDALPNADFWVKVNRCSVQHT